MSGEIRQNKATKEWVIYAPSRGKRPHDFQQSQGDRAELPTYDSQCPFCPGNEAMLPSILLELPGTPWVQVGDQWRTRVVPNKYPALTPDGDITRFTHEIYVSMQGYGHHEVIIETPRHNQQFVATPPHMRINHRCLRRTLRSSMGIEYVFVQHFNRLQTVLLSSAL